MSSCKSREIKIKLKRVEVFPQGLELVDINLFRLRGAEGVCLIGVQGTLEPTTGPLTSAAGASSS